MSSNASFMVFFDGPVSLTDAADRLSWSMHVDEVENVLSVRWDLKSEPVLRVSLSSAPHVLEEAKWLAKELDVSHLATLGRRFEVGFDDLEAALDESNTLIEVQAVLQELTGGYVVLPWNGNVISPK